MQYVQILSRVWLEPHARMYVWRVLSSAEHSQDWEKCACDEVFYLQPSPSLTRKSLLPESETPWKKSTNAQESCKMVATKVLQRVCSLPLFTTCDLAIGCLGVHDIAWFGVHASESLDVHVATNFVKMMKRKKVARNKFSKFDSSMLLRLILSSSE